MADNGLLLQIGVVARDLGITGRTIRYYEEIGLMGVPVRSEFGPRKYAKKDIVRLKFILKLKELGISLKEMHVLAANYDLNSQDRIIILPSLLEILDSNLNKIEMKISNLVALQAEISDYRSRIIGILNKESIAA